MTPGLDFLDNDEPYEIEELACVGDYIICRLWLIFDQIEDDLVIGKLPESIQREVQATQEDLETENWFGRDNKSRHGVLHGAHDVSGTPVAQKAVLCSSF